MAEPINLIFPYNVDCFLRVRPKKVGIRDSFDRIHWCSRRDVKIAVRHYVRDFIEKREGHNFHTAPVVPLSKVNPENPTYVPSGAIGRKDNV
jgi:hypothetical protein